LLFSAPNALSRLVYNLVCETRIKGQSNARPSVTFPASQAFDQITTIQGRREGGTRGTCPPPGNSHAEKNCGFLDNALLQMLLAYMSSASGGFAPRPPPGFCPWTPLGDF